MINQNWVFSTNCGLNFATNPPTPFTSNLSPAGEGCASISDANGTLLFYTDGLTVWDGTHAPIVSLPPLLGDLSSTQSSIIVPAPDNNREYYIFTIDGNSNTNQPYNHFNGIRINVDTWNATPLSNHMLPSLLFPSLTFPPVIGFSPAEKLIAIQHENCRDFWVITILQQFKNPKTNGTKTQLSNGPGVFRVFLVDPTGISHINDIQMNLNIHEAGYFKASPNGQRLAIANGENENVLVYPFNKATGAITISDLITIKVNEIVYGLEFSPNSAVLYFGSLTKGQSTGGGLNAGNLYQVDLTSASLANANIIASIPNQGLHDTGGSWYAIGALQLGIDGVIYFAKPAESSLGAIINPNIVGTGVNVNPNFVDLSPNKCGLGLPNLLPNACDDCNCNSSCSGCNQNATQQNDELIERAVLKYNTDFSTNNNPNSPTSPFPIPTNCENQAISSQIALEPSFYFHWGDGSNDQIEEHDTEVFYITVCNNFNDILFKGLRITQVTLNPNLPISSAHIVPDRFISIDCLEPCSCQTREFAIITRDNNIAGNYTLDVEYCYDEIIVSSSGESGTASFPLTITED